MSSSTPPKKPALIRRELKSLGPVSQEADAAITAAISDFSDGPRRSARARTVPPQLPPASPRRSAPKKAPKESLKKVAKKIVKPKPKPKPKLPKADKGKQVEVRKDVVVVETRYVLVKEIGPNKVDEDGKHHFKYGTFEKTKPDVSYWTDGAPPPEFYLQHPEDWVMPRKLKVRAMEM